MTLSEAAILSARTLEFKKAFRNLSEIERVSCVESSIKDGVIELTLFHGSLYDGYLILKALRQLKPRHLDGVKSMTCERTVLVLSGSSE